MSSLAGTDEILAKIFVHKRLCERERNHPAGSSCQKSRRAFVNCCASGHHVIHQHDSAPAYMLRPHNAKRTLQVRASLISGYLLEYA